MISNPLAFSFYAEPMGHFPLSFSLNLVSYALNSDQNRMHRSQFQTFFFLFFLPFKNIILNLFSLSTLNLWVTSKQVISRNLDLFKNSNFWIKWRFNKFHVWKRLTWVCSPKLAKGQPCIVAYCSLLLWTTCRFFSVG